MKLSYESELMKNQKHAEVMAPDVAFEVLQSSTGDALFFSIGTDHVFYVTREVRDTRTGWSKVDLSSVLSTSYAGAVVAAKSFALAQNPKNLAFDVALVVTVAGIDSLYLSTGNSAVPDAWTNGIAWTAVPFDATGITPPSPLTITDLYLMQVATTTAVYTLACFVDIVHNSKDPFEVVDRYYILPNSTTHWHSDALAADFAAGSISSCIGHRTHDRYPGIYTFGKIGDKKELIYTQQSQNPARLTLPDGATAVCSALNSGGDTNFFVAATSGLFMFPPDHQGDLAKPIQVVSGSVIAGTSTLAASTVGSRTAVWGINSDGDLFHLFCPAGSETNPASWSIPVPLCTNAERFAFYLNLNAANNVLFAHITGDLLLQLTQDPITTNWTQRNVLLPPTSINDMVEYNSYTTHIQISDDYGSSVSNIPVILTSTSPVPVYVNDVYHILMPNIPVKTTADVTGTVTIVQETQSLAGVCFRVALTDSPSVFADIDPTLHAMKTLGSVDDLGSAQITTADGKSKPLVPSSVDPTDTKAASSYVKQLLKVSTTLPPDGSAQTAAGAAAARLMASASESTHIPHAWGLSFGEDGMTYHEGDKAVQHFCNRNADNLLTAVSADDWDFNAIAIASGDLFRWIQRRVDDVKSVLVQEVEGIYHFMLHIGDEIYNGLLDCATAVVGAIEFVFNKIEVFFEDMIAWLGFIFNWGDIIRTHKVMKNILKQYATRAIGQIDVIETAVAGVFTDLENEVNNWAGLTDSGESVGSSESVSSTSPDGRNSPQSNWALHHTKSNISSAETSHGPPDSRSSALDSESDALDEVIADLVNLVNEESDDWKGAIDELNTQIVNILPSLTPGQIVNKLFGILANLVLKSAENVIVKTLDIIKIIATEIFNALDAPLQIPIISSLYKAVTDDDLTFLDLICLVGAIPVTIMFKLVSNAAPYPDNSYTQSLIDAPDFATLSRLLTNNHYVAFSADTHSSQQANISGTAGSSDDVTISMAPMKIAATVLKFSAFYGSALVSVFNILKRESLDVPPNALLRGSVVSYLLYAAPNFLDAFTNSLDKWTLLNDAITVIAIGKRAVDNFPAVIRNPLWNNLVSPFLQSVLNGLWIVPGIFMFKAIPEPQPSDKMTLASSVVSNVGGLLTFLTSPAVAGPDRSLIFFAAATGLALGYGILCAGTGFALILE